MSNYDVTGFPGKESLCQYRDTTDAGSIPGLGRSPGGGHDNPLQYSCLENPHDREAWRATVRRVAESWTRLKQLSTHTQDTHRMCQSYQAGTQAPSTTAGYMATSFPLLAIILLVTEQTFLRLPASCSHVKWGT